MSVDPNLKIRHDLTHGCFHPWQAKPIKLDNGMWAIPHTLRSDLVCNRCGEDSAVPCSCNFPLRDNIPRALWYYGIGADSHMPFRGPYPLATPRYSSRSIFAPGLQTHGEVWEQRGRAWCAACRTPDAPRLVMIGGSWEGLPRDDVMTEWRACGHCGHIHHYIWAA